MMNDFFELYAGSLPIFGAILFVFVLTFLVVERVVWQYLQRRAERALARYELEQKFGGAGGKCPKEFMGGQKEFMGGQKAWERAYERWTDTTHS